MSLWSTQPALATFCVFSSCIFCISASWLLWWNCYILPYPPCYNELIPWKQEPNSFNLFLFYIQLQMFKSWTCWCTFWSQGSEFKTRLVYIASYRHLWLHQESPSLQKKKTILTAYPRFWEVLPRTPEEGYYTEEPRRTLTQMHGVSYAVHEHEMASFLSNHTWTWPSMTQSWSCTEISMKVPKAGWKIGQSINLLQ